MPDSAAQKLVEQLTSAITNNDKEFSFDHQQIRKALQEYGLAHIRSHVSAQVGAATEACAKAICDRCRLDGMPIDMINASYLPPDGGPRFVHIDDDDGQEIECKAGAVRSRFPDATRELERVKAAARLEIYEEIADMGWDCSDYKLWARQRIRELTAAAKESK